VEKDYSLLENRLLVSEARALDLQRLVEAGTTEAELIQEKADIMALNLGLSERIRYNTFQPQYKIVTFNALILYEKFALTNHR
jgi:hypothetical protein